MYLRHLTIKNLRLIRGLELSFSRGGEHRPWTVLIGENGTGKTSILQAIAMAASGPTLATTLADSGRVDIRRSLRPRDSDKDMQITAEFGFGSKGHEGYGESDDEKQKTQRPYPRYQGERPDEAPRLYSTIEQRGLRDEVGASRGSVKLDGHSWYAGQENQEGGFEERWSPIEAVRQDRDLIHNWFVCAYGVDRNLPDPSGGGTSGAAQVRTRMQSLFGKHALDATAFRTHFTQSGNEALSESFEATLRRVVQATAGVFPNMRDVKLSATDTRSQRDPVERHRVIEDVDGRTHEIPTIWMSQGYQSSLAWIADLVGHILMEAQTPVAPEDMEGLVLIDELDLHLHPTWQVGLVEALKQVFPKLQFIATTHSPLVITGCEPDEVIRLERRDGQVVVVDDPVPAPRTLTGTRLYWNYFELERLIPNRIGQLIHEYMGLAEDGARSEEEERRLRELRASLEEWSERLHTSLVPEMHIMPPSSRR